MKVTVGQVQLKRQRLKLTKVVLNSKLQLHSR